MPGNRSAIRVAVSVSMAIALTAIGSVLWTHQKDRAKNAPIAVSTSNSLLESMQIAITWGMVGSGPPATLPAPLWYDATARSVYLPRSSKGGDTGLFGGDADLTSVPKTFARFRLDDVAEKRLTDWLTSNRVLEHRTYAATGPTDVEGVILSVRMNATTYVHDIYALGAQSGEATDDAERDQFSHVLDQLTTAALWESFTGKPGELWSADQFQLTIDMLDASLEETPVPWPLSKVDISWPGCQTVSSDELKQLEVTRPQTEDSGWIFTHNNVSRGVYARPLVPNESVPCTAYVQSLGTTTATDSSACYTTMYPELRDKRPYNSYELMVSHLDHASWRCAQQTDYGYWKDRFTAANVKGDPVCLGNSVASFIGSMPYPEWRALELNPDRDPYRYTGADLSVFSPEQTHKLVTSLTDTCEETNADELATVFAQKPN